MTFPTTHPALARTLAARDYSVPTAVQLAVLDANAATRDLLVSAQTGSGKTVAFGLAMAATLLGDAERFGQAAEPLALIIAPTRELAMQVQRELVWLYAEAGARSTTCVGGMDGREEARQLRAGTHIVVGTPGRLRDHLERKRLDLSTLKTVVLDEADEMLDLGFREDLEFILDATPETRQTLLFSATMPREIETLARSYQRDAIRIETGRRNEQHADIDYRGYRVAGHDIENAVVNVLRFNESRATLVFCATREAVKRMHARLMERGFSAVALSGELSQEQRNQALQSLRDGRARVLVATDVAARGLDLPDLALVIHADLPNDSETLLHRSGRTGRAGKKGMCALIVPFSKRRKAETLLNGAKLRVIWSPAPTADKIRAKDQERFLADAVFTDAATDEDLALVTSLQSSQTAEAIALALVRIHRASLPAPEDLSEDTGPPARRDGDRPRSSGFVSRAEGGETREPRERRVRDGFVSRGSEAPDKPFERDRERAPRAPRQDTRPMVWFRLNIGRERNADPRWLLPLICKAGDVTKTDIGAIKIFDRDTRFEIVADQADRFAEAIQSNKPKEGHISRVGDHTPAEDAPAPANDRPPRKTYEPKAETERASRKPYAPKADAAPRKPYDPIAPRAEATAEKAERKTERSEHKPKSDWKPRPKPFGASKSAGHSDGYKAREPAAASRDKDRDHRAKPFESRENRDRKPKEGGFAARGSARPGGFVARAAKPDGASRPDAKAGGKPASKYGAKSTYKTKKARQAESSGS